MDRLWAAIQSMSIKNKQWLADKLIEDLNQGKKNPAQKSKQEILNGIAAGFKDINDGHTFPLDEIWEQL